MKRLALGLIAATLALTGLVVTLTPAQAATPTCAVASKTFSTPVTNRPDSAVSTGGTWAQDTFTRTTTVTCTADGVYSVVLKDSGTFTTVAGASSPQVGTLINGVVSGSFTGSASFTVTSAQAPADPIAGKDGSKSSSEWAALVFPTATTVTGPTGWSWTYRHCDEVWINAEKASAGDITGDTSTCKPPTTTPKPPTSVPSTTTVTTPPVSSTKTVTVTNPGQVSVVPNTTKGVNTGDGSLA